MSQPNLKDTILALATPTGEGALGVIRVSGPEAIGLVDSVFRGKELSKQQTHTIHYGSIRDDNDRILDEVLVSLFVAPRSYTGEDVVEISCHGSPYILQEVMDLLLKKGKDIRLANAGEFTMRAFLNGRMDLSQAEAVADLIASQSAASHQVALQQMRGGFSDEIKHLRQQLIDFASLIELELDFSEEDVEFANREELRKLVEKIRGLLRNLIDSFKLGNVIKNGVSTVIAGRPNAGKSTLLNALLNEERAIVSDIAGTTRDTIEETLNINGIQFRLIDTAGIREAEDAIETLGIERTMEKVQQSALLVYIFDIVQTSPGEVQSDLQKLIHDKVEVLVVANKMDLNPYAKFEDFFPERKETSTPKGGPKNNAPEPRAAFNPQHSTFNITSSSWIPVSAIHQMNIPHLKEKLYEAVLSQKINLENPIVTNARHHHALEKAHQRLDDVLKGMDQGVTSDFVAMDIRQALHFLGEITGEISTEDLLGNIFANFCIGK